MEAFKNKRIIAAGTTGYFGLMALTGCSTTPEERAPLAPAVITENTEAGTSYAEDFPLEREFTLSGEMVSSVIVKARSGEPTPISTVWSYCMGNDLIDINTFNSGFLRSPLHSACDDGKLKAEDFPVNPQMEN